ncbi:hypothetical protein Q4R36_17190 [Morganella morganii]
MVFILCLSITIGLFYYIRKKSKSGFSVVRRIWDCIIPKPSSIFVLKFLVLFSAHSGLRLFLKNFSPKPVLHR